MMESLLEHCPTWAELRKVGNSYAVRASIVVPVIGYLIILNSTVADYLKLHGIEWARHDPPSSFDRLWSLKLYFIYVGLMSLGVGSAIYQLKCPHFIKKYADWVDYVAGTALHMDIEQLHVFPEILHDSGDALRGNHVIYESLNDFDARQDTLRRYLRKHYRQMSEQDRLWRSITTTCFAIGFSFLAIPSLMTAWRVAIAFTITR